MSSKVFARLFLADKRCVIWSDGRLDDQTVRDWLDAQQLPKAARQIGSAGRGSAWELPSPMGSLALRHYRRGGWIAKLSKDLYVWLGVKRTRCAIEFDIMKRLSESGLPVPKPVAAIACRYAWVFYRAALITEWVSHVGSLGSQTDPEAWRAAGRSIARLHAAGIWHADLNVHNILIDERGDAWIIDFDRARQNVFAKEVLEGNLKRLLRSVRKVCPDRHGDCWSALLEGYAQAGACV